MRRIANVRAIVRVTPDRQDFPDTQTAAPRRFAAHCTRRQVVGNRMDGIATFNWSIAIDFAIVNDARVRNRTESSAASRLVA